MMDFKKLISDRIRMELLRKNMKVAELAKITGFSPYQINNILYKRASKLEVIKAVAKKLEIPLEDMLSTYSDENANAAENANEFSDPEKLLKTIGSIKDVLMKENKQITNLQMNLAIQCLNKAQLETLDDASKFHYVRGIIDAISILRSN